MCFCVSAMFREDLKLLGFFLRGTLNVGDGSKVGFSLTQCTNRCSEEIPSLIQNVTAFKRFSKTYGPSLGLVNLDVVHTATAER